MVRGEKCWIIRQVLWVDLGVVRGAGGVLGFRGRVPVEALGLALGWESG